MSIPNPTQTEVDYPESDGEPMAESDLHRDWMVDIIQMLKYYFAGQVVYVSGNLLIYYVEGKPQFVVSPDAFVVKDCAPRQRPIFKIWEEKRVPNFALETTSKTTWREDQRKKMRIYAELGIAEYFLYDPLAEWLDPPLIGLRLVDEEYVWIEPDAQGGIASEQLGITFRLDEDGRLTLFETATGKRLLTDAERAAEANVQAAEARTVAAEAAIQAAEARTVASQAEARAAEAEARLAQETAARKALEEELTRLRAERDQ